MYPLRYLRLRHGILTESRPRGSSSMLILEEKEMAASPKPLAEVVKARRATPDFDSSPVPDADLKQILEAGRNAPSGYNLQPWRFVVVRDAAQRKALRGAAFNQAKVEDAPVVIVAVAALKAWQQGDLDKVAELSMQHGFTQQQADGMRK